MASSQQPSVKRLKNTVRSSEVEVRQLEATLKRLASELAFLRKLDPCPPDCASAGDVEFVSDKQNEETIKAHQFVLASRSSVFRNLFENDMENKSRLVHISDTCAPVLRAFLNFLYKAEITFGPDVSACDVYELAVKFDVAELTEVCEQNLLRTIDDKNLVKVLELAHRYKSKQLYPAAVKYFKYHFDDVQEFVIGSIFSRKTQVPFR